MRTRKCREILSITIHILSLNNSYCIIVNINQWAYSYMKKILITGVAGMIGSHLLDALLEQKTYEIFGIDDLSFGKLENIAHNINNPLFKFYRISVTDFESLKILGRDIDIIVHLAAVKKISESDSAIQRS